MVMADKTGRFLDDILSPGLGVNAAVNDSAMESIPAVVSHLIWEEQMSALRAWRIYLGISVRALSVTSGISVPAIEFLDKGGIPLCQWTAARIAVALKVVSVQNILAAEELVAWSKSCRTAADTEAGATSDRNHRRDFGSRPSSYISKA